jgi:hypothetical protein
MMWDWLKPETGGEGRTTQPDRPHGNRNGQHQRGPPEPREWEAHRRYRTFDERGVIQDETHEALRVKYRKRGEPSQQLTGRRLAEMHWAPALLIASLMHGALWWGWMGTVAFSNFPLAALAWIPIIWISLGGRFLLAHALFFTPASALLLAFDGWVGWAAVLPIAALMGPGKWLEGEW